MSSSPDTPPEKSPDPTPLIEAPASPSSLPDISEEELNHRRLMGDMELITYYFKDETVQGLIDKELGQDTSISVDWGRGRIIAAGSKARKTWDLYLFLARLRLQIH